MKKKTNIKTVIRNIVREEVAMAIKEVITELKQPPQVMTAATGEIKKNNTPKKKVVEKKEYSKNSVLNDILNETAQQGEEWKTMGGGTYDSGKMNQVMASNYGNLMTSDGKPNIAATTTGLSGAAATEELEGVLNRDYSDVMKAIDEKKKRK